ncbi:MAG TPA: o-succinylbenzoate synthase [Acidobacteriaceae bacterium]|nr:o-succinylbenzoate synthase [Acidobacteriaceae bacterium]
MCRSVEELEQAGPIEIQAIELARVAVPMLEPFRISSGEVSCKEALLVRFENGASFGWGESSAMPGGFYSQDTPDGCERQLLKVLPFLPGRQFKTMRELELYLVDANLSPFVRVALETAAWELLARQRNLPLGELFGLSRKPVESGLAVGLYPTLQELRAALDRYEPRQYSRLKIKIKRGQDLDLVRAVRDWYGAIPLFVDANADYTRTDIETLRVLDRFHLMMIEQPFARGDLASSAALQNQIGTPLCFDEGIESAADVHEAAKADACRIVNIKLQRVGGFLEALRVAEACAESRMPFWMGTMPELGVGSAQALVLATHRGCAYPTDVEPSARWYTGDILHPELCLRGNRLEVPHGPGLGFAIDQAAIGRYETAHWSFTA